MLKAELPSQFSRNGHAEQYDLSPKDRRLFVNKATKSPVPDIDAAKTMLPRVEEFYKELGVPPSDRKRQAQVLETMLFKGTAKQQIRASDSLLSLSNAYEAIRSSVRQEKNKTI